MSDQLLKSYLKIVTLLPPCDSIRRINIAVEMTMLFLGSDEV
jgi:hypothetical protein